MPMNVKEILEADFKPGDVMYECEYGHNIKIIVKTPPVLNEDELTWEGVHSDNVTTRFLICKGSEHYGPRIYKSPAYSGKHTI